jgi:Bacteriophage clamp loader A subunit
MNKPFDYINAVNYSKEDIMITEEDESAYIPFITNKTLSYFPDTVMHANLMNLNHIVSNKAQFSYFINSLRPRKRYTKWVKKLENSDLDVVKQYYNFNNSKAESALSLLSTEQLDEIKLRLIKGG